MCCDEDLGNTWPIYQLLCEPSSSVMDNDEILDGSPTTRAGDVCPPLINMGTKGNQILRA
jgi:hypothetical protein